MIVKSDRRGQTCTGKFTYRPLFEATEDDFPPCSNYWCRRAETAKLDLDDQLGAEESDAWLDATLTDEDNPRVCAEKIERYLHDLNIAKEQEKS